MLKSSAPLTTSSDIAIMNNGAVINWLVIISLVLLILCKWDAGHSSRETIMHAMFLGGSGILFAIIYNCIPLYNCISSFI